ncbi:MAG: hypothetical protein GYB31_01650 [Bacteroidetes bacterium]|nr:hypothetical protein [Bacteroidota bacterium]
MFRKFTLFILIVLFASCAKDVELFIPYDNQPDPQAGLVTTSLTGVLTDTDGNPISAQEVYFGNASTQTDGFGVFHFSEVEVPVSHAPLQFDVPGYYINNPVLNANENGRAFVRIILRERVQTASFDASGSSTVDPDDNFSFQTENDMLRDENGDHYTGEVAVFSARFDPTNISDFRQIPGNWFGENLMEEEAVLEPFAAFVLEMEDLNGQALSLKSDNPLIANVRVPAAIASEAPSEIGLWLYDAGSGLWTETAQAFLNGDFYEAEINQLGTWAFARGHDYVEIEGVTRDDDSRGFVHAGLSIRFEAGNYCAAIYVDDEGSYALRIPANTNLVLDLLNDCEESVYMTSLSGFDVNTVLPPVIVDQADAWQTYVRGRLINCNDQPLESAYAWISSGDWTKPVLVNADGSFQAHVSSCGATLYTLQGVSLSGDALSLSLSHSLYQQAELGSINVCPDIPEAFSGFNVDGEEFLSLETEATMDADVLHFEEADQNLQFSLATTPGVPGEYQVLAINQQFGPYSEDEIQSMDVKVVLETFGVSENHLEGTINGYFTDTDGNDHWVFGRFRSANPL